MHPHCRCSTAPVFEKSESGADSKYDYMEDVTSQWVDGKDHAPSLNISDKVTKDGNTYIVDGHNVVSDHSNYEHKVAHWLSTKTGLKVDILPRVNNPERINTPDYLLNDIPFDLKEVTGSGKNVIDGNLRKTKKQAPNIIFDITKSPLYREEIMRQIEQVYKIGRRELQITIVKDGDELLCVLIPKK